MAVTMAQVRAVLDPDETNYERARALGPEALPHLETLIKTAEPMLASKAAYLAGLLAEPGSARVVAQAAAHAEPTVRVAAAAAAKHLNDHDIEEVLTPLLEDADEGVRKVARSSRRGASAEGESGSGEMPKARGAERKKSKDASASGEMPGMPGHESDAEEMPGASNQGEMPAFPSSESSGSGEMPGFPDGGGTGEMPGPRYTPGEMPH